MKQKKLLFIGILLTLLFAGSFSISQTYAQAAPTPTSPSGTTKTLEKNKTEIICGSDGVNLPGCVPSQAAKDPTGDGGIVQQLIFNTALAVGVAAIITIMIAGIMYILSMGNDEKEKKARKIIEYSIRGLIFTLLAYILVQITVNLRFR